MTADLAVHHAGRAEHMRPGVGLRHGHPAIDLQGGVVVHVAVVVEHAAVAMVGEFVQADVTHHHEVVADLGSHVPDGLVQYAVRVQRSGALGIAPGRDAEEHDAADPQLHGLRGGTPERVTWCAAARRAWR